MTVSPHISLVSSQEGALDWSCGSAIFSLNVAFHYSAVLLGLEQEELCLSHELCGPICSAFVRICSFSKCLMDTHVLVMESEKLGPWPSSDVSKPEGITVQ